MRHKLTRYQQDRNNKNRRGKLAGGAVDPKAAKAFKRDAYQAANLVKAQEEQMERNDVLGYLDKKGIKGEMRVGQEDS